jgi:nicotinamidase-related amidase
MRILKEDTLGLIIDIQEKLLPHIHANESVLHLTTRLVEGFKILDIPILLTEQYPKGLGQTVMSLKESLDSVCPLEKITFSCCDDDNFLKNLSEIGRRNVIICGIEAHVCVLQTTIDLFAEEFQPVVVEDCVSSRNSRDKDVAIHRMRQEGAIITTSESILFELARTSGTETFKAISKLVK